jgi:hypothetical protein
MRVKDRAGRVASVWIARRSAATLIRSASTAALACRVGRADMCAALGAASVTLAAKDVEAVA